LSIDAEKMKFLSVVGARPQFIKLSPLCRAIEFQNSQSSRGVVESVIVHTGQHYDYELSKVFFDQMRIPTPKYNL
jgi:UDP-N-acetylglucosamine 2-epimerase